MPRFLITEKIKKSIGVDISEQSVEQESENTNLGSENQKNTEPQKEEVKKENLKKTVGKTELKKEKK